MATLPAHAVDVRVESLPSGGAAEGTREKWNSHALGRLPKKSVRVDSGELREAGAQQAGAKLQRAQRVSFPLDRFDDSIPPVLLSLAIPLGDCTHATRTTRHLINAPA